MLRTLLLCVGLVSLNPVLAYKEPPPLHQIEVTNRWSEARVVFYYYVSTAADLGKLSITDVLLDQIVVYDVQGKVKQTIDYRDANQELWFQRFADVLTGNKNRKQQKIAANPKSGTPSGYLIFS